MILIKIINEVTIGILGIIPLAIYLFAVVGIAIGFIYLFKCKTTSLRLSMGILLLFVSSYILPEILIRVVFFPGGDYVNYGLGGGIIRVILIGVVSIFAVFIISIIIYGWKRNNNLYVM